MTTTTSPDILVAPQLELGNSNGGSAARRAVVRWAWRLFRREWRQQLLVLALIVVAVAATILAATAALAARAPAAGTFGSAQDLATFAGSGPKVASQIAALEQRFGKVDVIENQTLRIPGSIDTYQLRSQDPHGAYGTPMLSLVSGHYPSGAGQVAMTGRLASDFHLRTGDVWNVGGTSRQLVGIVSNPQSLLDEFALVAPGEVGSPTQVTVLFDARGLPPSSIGPNVQARGSATPGNAINPETISIAGLTIGMLLIALVSVGGFTVLAQRRLRSLGMLGSLGATDRNVGLVVRANGVVTGVVGALIGTVVAFLLWLAYRPHLESSSHHVIGVWAIPWSVVLLAIVLATVATYFAASRPAKAMSRVPIVQALSGRPAPPRQIHRSAVPGIVFFVLAFLLLGYSGGQHYAQGGGGGAMIFLVLGLVALIPGVILLSPFFLTLLARLGRRTPVAVRLALRDLARYRARSGSALSAISIGVMIAVIVAIVAAARYGNYLDYAGPNVASNQIILYTPSNGPNSSPVNCQKGCPPVLSAGQIPSLNKTADAIGSSIGAKHVVGLYTTSANLNYANAGNGRNWNGQIYVATPSLLGAFGIEPSEINPNADILTMRPGISTLSACSSLGATATPSRRSSVLGRAPRVRGPGRTVRGRTVRGRKGTARTTRRAPRRTAVSQTR
jgi:putative ABC transport system permease protein